MSVACRNRLWRWRGSTGGGLSVDGAAGTPTIENSELLAARVGRCRQGGCSTICGSSGLSAWILLPRPGGGHVSNLLAVCESHWCHRLAYARPACSTRRRRGESWGVMCSCPGLFRVDQSVVGLVRADGAGSSNSSWRRYQKSMGARGHPSGESSPSIWLPYGASDAMSLAPPRRTRALRSWTFACSCSTRSRTLHRLNFVGESGRGE